MIEKLITALLIFFSRATARPLCYSTMCRLSVCRRRL